MPNLENAKKALRQSAKRAQRNTTVKAEIHSLRVKLRKTLADKQMQQALELAKTIGKKLDKAGAKKIFKKNTAARYKSRIMKKINAIKSA